VHIKHGVFHQLLIIFLILLLTACSKSGGGGSEKPKISGSLPETAIVGAPLDLSLEVKGLEGQLTFSLENSPDWLSINPQTGELAGTPPEESQGQEYVDVIVVVTNGQQTLSLPPQTIRVLFVPSIETSVSRLTIGENESTSLYLGGKRCDKCDDLTGHW
jgi:hypothetical protein